MTQPQVDASLAQALVTMRAGGIVLHATEAVWGLACDAGNADAVQAIHALKQRSTDKGLIVIADTYARVAHWLGTVEAPHLAAAEATWPGPHTWVFPASAACPPWLAGERGTLAVRISAHPQVLALARGLAAPLVSTSANSAGQPAAHGLDDVEPVIRAGVDFVLTGQTGGLDRPTTVRDARTGAWLRR